MANEYAEIGLPVTEVYDMHDHLGGNQNWWLLQGDNGLIYTANAVGLTEWDGERWHIYRTPNQSIVRSITQWHDGRIYAGTLDDFGFYAANQLGSLTYHSLIDDWTPEQRQFGEIWSTAANQHGVVFLSTQALFFWDGKRVIKLAEGEQHKYRIFALNDDFMYKNRGDNALYKITFDTSSKEANPLLSFKVQRTTLNLPEQSVVRQIFYNRNKNLVVITAKHGIYEESDGDLVLRVHSEKIGADVHIYNGTQAGDGFYYTTSLNHGLFIFNDKFELLRQYTEEHAFGTNTLLSVMEDRQGNIWLAGTPNIVKMTPPHVFSYYATQGNPKLTEHIALVNNRLTFTGDGLYGLQLADNPRDPPSFTSLTSHREINWHFIEYHTQLLYAGTGGVFAVEANNNSPSTTHAPVNEAEQLIDAMWAKGLAIDPITGQVFAATTDGLFQLSNDGSRWQSQKIPGIDDDLHYIAISDSGVIWIGTASQELYRIENAQHADQKTKIIKFTERDGLGPNNVIPFKMSFGIVFGTNDGLMDYQPERQPALQFIEGLPAIFTTKGQDVYRLYEDNNQRIWYRIGNSTGFIEKDEKGVWQTNERIFKPFSKDSYKGFVQTAENILWFSKVNGEVFRINIERLNSLPEAGMLKIRKIFKLGTDQEIYGGANIPLLPTLDQQNNSIRIHFALTDNSISNAAQYRHRILGSGNEKWSDWSAENYTDFTQLHGANYTLQLEAKDGWDRTSATELTFVVSPPWYLSQTAWVVYTILAIGLLFITAWLAQWWRGIQLNQRNQELEHIVSQRTQEVQAKAKQLQQQQTQKDRFFANVSHEFRTPLTLTIAPLETILKDYPDLQKSARFSIETAIRNAKKMLALVGQILDINRLESGSLPLRVAEYDVADLINQIVLRFRPWAEQHHQILSAANTQQPVLVYFDQDQLDKCISNLISNAIKYSGKQSKITVSIITKAKNGDFPIGIEVRDTGKGISPGSEAKVFERFYQGPQSEQVNEPGTGVGLALVKELLDLHRGKVELVNHPDEGCQFRLWLRKGANHFDQSQLLKTIEHSSATGLANDVAPMQSKPEPVVENRSSKDNTTLLVVDDNSELRHFIALRLSSYYRIIEAENGEQGLSKARQQLPDLIISDVMMPVMNGLEMTQALKSDPETQSIPLILLTAKSSKRETVEGLQVGADDYLTKPFDTSELIVRVAGLINSRKVLRQSIEAEFSSQAAGITPQHSFAEKLHAEIHAQLSSPAFNIDILCSVMAMSRASLNRKCQKELGKSAKQCIIETRMNLAMSLLKKNKHTVSEIAYGTGYESLNYFSRSFKKHFGHSPSEMLKIQ